MKILVVEDDCDVANFVAKGLTEQGYGVDIATDGRNGLFLATGEPYDAIVLDRMLPIMDGLTVLEALRKSGSGVPVLLLSALSDVNERIRGLRAGSDDYLTKPFAFQELLVRLEVLLRRGQGSARIETVLRVADLELDLLARSVRRQGRVIELQPREFQLLAFFMRHLGQVVTRTILLEGVWNYHFDPQTNVIDVHVSRLRQKIDRGFPACLLQTIRGAGYTLRAPD